MEKLLTVVIPTYNTEQFLRNCIDSLLTCESAECTELLVVDDGSTDASGQIADEYAKRYPSIVKVVHKKNGGHGSAINTGIALATGKYFKVVDSDDTVESLAYETFLQILRKVEKENCDLVATPFVCVRYIENVLGKVQIKIQKHQIEGTEGIPRGEILSFGKAAIRLHIRMHEWTIRTIILKQHNIRLLEHSFYVDMQYILYPVPWIQTVCILEEEVYRYRLGRQTQSVSIRNMQKNRTQHRNVLRSLIRFYKERETKGDSEIVLSYLARGIAKMETNQVQIALSLPIGKRTKAELIECERELKQNCPAAYQANEKKSITLIRNSNYIVYPIASIVWRILNR